MSGRDGSGRLEGQAATIRLPLLPRSVESREECGGETPRGSRHPSFSTPPSRWSRPTPCRRRRVPCHPEPPEDLPPNPRRASSSSSSPLQESSASGGVPPGGVAGVSQASVPAATPQSSGTAAPTPSTSHGPPTLLCRNCSALILDSDSSSRERVEDKGTQTAARRPRKKKQQEKKEKEKCPPRQGPAAETEGDMKAEFLRMLEEVAVVNTSTMKDDFFSGSEKCPPLPPCSRHARAGSPPSCRRKGPGGNSNMAARRRPRGGPRNSRHFRLGVSPGRSRGMFRGGPPNQVHAPCRMSRPFQRLLRRGRPPQDRPGIGTGPSCPAGGLDGSNLTPARRRAGRPPGRKSAPVATSGSAMPSRRPKRPGGPRGRRRRGWGRGTTMVLRGYVWDSRSSSDPAKVSGTLVREEVSPHSASACSNCDVSSCSRASSATSAAVPFASAARRSTSRSPTSGRAGSRSRSRSPSRSPSGSRSRSGSADWHLRNRSNSAGRTLRSSCRERGAPPPNTRCQHPCKVAGLPSCLSLHVRSGGSSRSASRERKPRGDAVTSRGRGKTRQRRGGGGGGGGGRRRRRGGGSSLEQCCCSQCPVAAFSMRRRGRKRKRRARSRSGSSQRRKRRGRKGRSCSCSSSRSSRPRKRRRKRGRGKSRSCCSKSRGSSRSKSRSRSRSKSRSKSRPKSRSKSRPKSRSKSRPKARSKSRSKPRSKSRSKPRSKSQGRGRSCSCKPDPTQRKRKSKAQGRKSRGGRKRKTKAGHHVTELCALRLVRHAIWALREPKGSTEAQIRRYIERQYELVEPRRAKPVVHRAVLSCLQDSSLKRSPQSRARFLLVNPRSLGPNRRKSRKTREVQTEPPPSMFDTTARARKYLSKLGPAEKEKGGGSKSKKESGSDEVDKCCIIEKKE